MNVLMFVMSLLMILALLTYGRLDMYRNFVVTQGEFEKYISKGERQVINSGAQQWYEWTTLTAKNGDKPKKQAPKDASPKLSVGWLFKSKDQANSETNKELLKKLIFTVFGSQNDFKNALDNNPNLVDDLIRAMELASQKLITEKKPPKTIEGLENLDLENAVLQDSYYFMLKGYPISKRPILVNKERLDDLEESNEVQQEEYLHKEGTISLLDFLTLNPSKTKIRVFLAPKALLMAIFEDPYTVDEILHDRLEFYHQVKNEGDSSALSEQFKQKFASRSRYVPENFLDFTVTGSDPRNYEVL